MKNLYKSVAIAAIFSMSCASASAQALTSYFMPNAADKLQHNAAFAPERGYFNIPLMGALELSSNGNIAMGDLLTPSADGSLVTIFDTSISAAQALSGLNSTNTFGLTNRIGILGFGKYCKDKSSFWSFDLNLNTSANFSMPYELVEFLKESPDQITIKDLNVYMESYVEAAFGYSRKYDDKLTVGGRAKLLVGLMNASLNIDQMDVTMNADEWTAVASGTLDINANGIGANTAVGDNFELGDIDGSVEGVAGYGAAIDLGATYDLTDRIRLSLAANDLGFMLWGKESNTSATVAKEFSFTGVSYDNSTGETTESDEISLDDIEFVENNSKASTNWLQSSVSMSGEYSFFDDRLKAGLIYEIDFWKTKTMHNLTIAGAYTPINCFTVAASYALTDNTLGLALNFATGFMNLYLATDILTAKKSAQLIPINQSMMNVSFGLAVPFGAKGERNL